MAIKKTGRMRLLEGLAADDVKVIVGACDERMLVAGEELFQEGDEGDSIWIIESGRGDIYKSIRPGVDRTLASLGPGEIIGEVSFIDHSLRSAGARTTESSEFLVLSREAFQKLQKKHPKVPAGFYRFLAVILATRQRTTNELYRASVAFSIEATGAGRLNLTVLSEELRPVTIHLSCGDKISGHILQMDNSPAGYTLVLKDCSGKLSIIPYHAVQLIELA